MSANDPFNLARFVGAQDPVYGQVVRELRGGRKWSHWMWFVFPQLSGLGRSATAGHYAISGLDEARSYLAHTLLGGRLRECTGLVLEVERRTAHEIFGSPDDLKFRSSMTLFAKAAEDAALFERAIGKYFGGEFDEITLRILAGSARTAGK